MIDFVMAFASFAFGLGGGFVIGIKYQQKKQKANIEEKIYHS